MMLIFMHELGHFLTAKLCKWETEKIELYPYGGITKFQTPVNIPINQELFVLIMGPITQILTFIIISPILSERMFVILKEYHNFLLWFNLLPIYPLDGGRLWDLLFCKVLSFRKSFYIIMIISYITIALLSMSFLIEHSFLLLCVLCLLIFKLQKEKEIFPYIYQKFLLERILYQWNFPKKKIVVHEKQMKRDTYHFFKKENTYWKEEDYLKRKINEIRKKELLF